MIPEKVREKAEKILKNEYFSELDGDEIIIKPKENNFFFAYVKSDKQDSFGQAIIDSDDLSFLWSRSGVDSDVLLNRFKGGIRSIPHQKKKARRNIELPVINEDTGIIEFAKKMTDAFISLFDEQDNDAQDPLEGRWHDMIYNGLVLLLSTREPDTKLSLLTIIYTSPSIVKTYLKSVKNREVYDYWTTKVPQFIKEHNSRELIYLFNIRIASLIGEQEIQDLCLNLKEK